MSEIYHQKTLSPESNTTTILGVESWKLNFIHITPRCREWCFDIVHMMKIVDFFFKRSQELKKKDFFCRIWSKLPSFSDKRIFFSNIPSTDPQVSYMVGQLLLWRIFLLFWFRGCYGKSRWIIFSGFRTETFSFSHTGS